MLQLPFHIKYCEMTTTAIKICNFFNHYANRNFLIHKIQNPNFGEQSLLTMKFMNVPFFINHNLQFIFDKGGVHKVRPFSLIVCMNMVIIQKYWFNINGMFLKSIAHPLVFLLRIMRNSPNFRNFQTLQIKTHVCLWCLPIPKKFP